MLPCRGHQRVHVGALAVEMHRHQCLDPPARRAVGQLPCPRHTAILDEGLHRRRRQIEGHRIDVAEQRTRAGPGNGPRRCKKGKRRGNHLIPRADFQGHEGEQQGIGARGDADTGRRRAIA